MAQLPANGAVLVTGASTGIGRATALMLARSGFSVFAGVRKPQDAESLVAESLVAERAGALTPLIIDVTDGATIAAGAEVIEKSVGASGLAGLVNNAGIAAAAPLEFVPIDDFRRQLEVNVTGQLAVTQAVLPLLRVGRGRIVNITSIGGLIAGPMLGPYHASKFALEALTDTLRIELAPWGIHVVAVEPGQIATPIWATSSATSDRMLAGSEDASHALYGERIAGARAMATRAAAEGISPDRVAEVILRALTVKRPRTRYPVGTDAKIGSAIIAKLPDRLRDRLMVARRSG
jgi:NAD(P)-dependent dehydrogenase (short-subunit alcohol dehydrogenase family)